MDMSTRESGKRCMHQRFPVHGPGTQSPSARSEPDADRVVIDFFPIAFSLDFGGVAGDGVDDQLLLRGRLRVGLLRRRRRAFPQHAGRRDCSRIWTSPELARRLEQVLVAMTADPPRRLSSMDVLDAAERARLDAWGNRAVLTPAGGHDRRRSRRCLPRRWRARRTRWR